MMNVSQDPSYLSSPTGLETKSAKALLSLIIIVAIFLLIYLIFFGVTLIRNFYFFFQLTPRARGLFLFSVGMLLIMIMTLIFGVYSPLYSNGHLFVFFNALCNIYVWALIYLNWPVLLEDHSALSYD
jgi:hypothetical protein